MRRPVALLRSALTLLLVTCAPTAEPVTIPGPSPGTPEIRIGLALGVSDGEVSGDSGLIVLDTEGAAAAGVEAGTSWRVRATDGAVSAAGPGWSLGAQRTVTFQPRTAGGLVAWNGRDYHGKLVVAADRSGLTIINVVGLEDYLAGVIGAEMGRRDSTDAEALAAQAIVSRTFAIRNLGKRAADGFDLLATVADQVYGGVGSEYPLVRWAVGSTRGEVLTWQGAPIDAFFFSTCAGRTAGGTEVFVAADRPYLVSVPDTDAGGAAYCRISPRYRWREEWTGAQLRGTLGRTLPAVAGVPASEVSGVKSVEVGRRSNSGRVARVTVTLDRRTVDVDGPQVRQVLAPAGQATLRSAIFTLAQDRTGGHVTRLVADGAGAGHGVGFCQWGAVGRARAGQDASTILAAYFPGTAVSRAY